MAKKFTRRVVLTLPAATATAALASGIAPHSRAVEGAAPVASEYAPIDDTTYKEIWRLAREALPITCWAESIGKPWQRRWVVDRVMVRLATGEGTTHALAAMVEEERRRCPKSWTSGYPEFLSATVDIPHAVYTPPSAPYGINGTLETLGMFVQARDGAWHYRLRIEGTERSNRPSWMVDYQYMAGSPAGA